MKLNDIKENILNEKRRINNVGNVGINWMYGWRGRPRASSDLITTWNLHLYWVHTMPPRHILGSYRATKAQPCIYLSIMVALYSYNIYFLWKVFSSPNSFSIFHIIVKAKYDDTKITSNLPCAICHVFLLYRTFFDQRGPVFISVCRIVGERNLWLYFVVCRMVSSAE